MILMPPMRQCAISLAIRNVSVRTITYGTTKRMGSLCNRFPKMLMAPVMAHQRHIWLMYQFSPVNKVMSFRSVS